MIKFEVNQQAGTKIALSRWRGWLKKIQVGLKLKKNLEISIAIVGDQTIRRLNKTYRRHNQVTDVLSFSESDRQGKPSSSYLGEIIICYPQARRQAKTANHSPQKEIQLLLTHGFLHLLGYDHETASEAKVMERLENEIMQRTVKSK